MKRRFAVAFSLASEQGEYVADLANRLGDSFGRSRVFYYPWYSAEIPTPDMDLKLDRIYRHDSDIIVACLSKDYANKKWTGLEGRVIRALIHQGFADRIVLLHFDGTAVDGIHEIGGYLDTRVVPKERIAEIICERHHKLPTLGSEHKVGPDTMPARPNNIPGSIGTLFKGRDRFLEEFT